MRISITGRNLDISDGWRAKIEKKVFKLDKYLRDDSELQVRLSQEHGTRNTAEITILLPGAILRAEETGAEMSACLDKVLDKIVRQIHRHRTRIEKRLRAGAFELPRPNSPPKPPKPRPTPWCASSGQRQAHQRRGGHHPDGDAGPQLPPVF